MKQDASHGDRVLEITNRIHAANNVDEILIDLKDEIVKLFEAERLTIYVVDGIKKELVSKVKSGDEISEIRLPISAASLAGYVAYKGRLLNIKDVHDHNELAAIDPNLRFDKTWDRKTRFQTRQVLVSPVSFQKYLLGAIQVMNRKDGRAFNDQDEVAVRKLARTLGIALFNQKRMVKARPGKFDYLVENGLLTQKELDRAVHEARKTRQDIEFLLMKNYKISKKDIGKALSLYYKAPFVEYNERTPIPGELLGGLKVPFMKKNYWVPIGRDGEKIIVAIDNPYHLQKVDIIKPLFSGKELLFHVALKEDILKYINLFFQDEKKQSSIDEIIGQLEVEEKEIDEAQKGVTEEDSAIVQLVNKMILDAYARNASDIHVEPYPGKKNTEVRFRIDGACQLYQTVPYNYRAALVSRIKIMSDLDIAERRKPQDGKIKFKKYGGKEIELRVATVPIAGGLEDVVMRILAAGEPIPLDKMGFSEKNYENFLSIVTKPYGIIFVCGPTGSGKTTTLHSALGCINKPEIKIWTAEDPVEITQAGLRQVQVQHKIGFDFATAMRAFLRADPDVIMVGEMRDKETTHIGIEASLTGHLVFSTLHTNSAPESITRLLDMGMDPFNFADAILGILAQRLVRTLCKKCKKPYNPSREEYDELVREYGPEAFKGLNIPYSKDLVLYKTAGCSECNNTGYRGRMGIHELLMGTDEMKKLIQMKAEMEDIRDQAVKDGMTTLKQDGVQKVFTGHTDLLQVRKVCIK
ncbi:MAG: GspE/PulE family protein [Deltaproteobacteria bacterium]|nr:GspE/PulE family protein [Deltaproteobacteria bacterium]MBW1795126.1 GspE/PulE family protein [Deltaproteobacteria bacterium]